MKLSAFKYWPFGTATCLVSTALYSTYRSDLADDAAGSVLQFLTPRIAQNNSLGYEARRLSSIGLSSYDSIIKSEIDKNLSSDKKFLDQIYESNRLARNHSEDRYYKSFLYGTQNLWKNDLGHYIKWGNSYRRISSRAYKHLIAIGEAKEEFNKLKSSITFKGEDYLMKNLNNKSKSEVLPYNIDDKLLESLVQNLPRSNKFKRYWVDVTKNNDEGFVEISVFGRHLWWNSDDRDFDLYTERLKHYKISGFQKFPHKDILSERVLRVFVHGANWLEEGIPKPSFSDYKYGYNSAWYRHKFDFVHVGSALVLDKELDSPVYYIATNKHVINAIIPKLVIKDNKTYVYTNHYRVKTSDGEHLPPMHISPTDALFNWTQGEKGDLKDKNPKNLKGYITFGSNKPLNKYKNLDRKFLNTIFEFNNKNKDIIKSIKLVNDFTYPHTIISSDTASYRWSPNKSFLKLNSINPLLSHEPRSTEERLMDNIEKNSADFVILKVEFNSEQDDPFSSWWTKRPTKIRSLDDRDVFNRSWVSKGDNYFGDSYNNLTNSDYWSVGYSSYRNDCDYYSRKNRNTELSIRRGVGDNHINQSFWSSYSKQNVAGKLRFEKEDWIQTRGASGSPIFDKNGNTLGLLWSGTSANVPEYCRIKDNSIYNLFFWFGSNLNKDFLYMEDKFDVSDFDRPQIPKYNFITDANRYSFFSEMKNQKGKEINTYLYKNFRQFNKN